MDKIPPLKKIGDGQSSWWPYFWRALYLMGRLHELGGGVGFLIGNNLIYEIIDFPYCSTFQNIVISIGCLLDWY